MPVSKHAILNLWSIGSVSLFLFFAGADAAQAQQRTPDENRIWTTVGSAGTLDKNDINKVFFDHSAVQAGIPLGGNQSPARNPALLPFQPESAVVRYNITPVDGLFPLPVAAPNSSGVQMMLRYLAVRAQVIANLIEVDLDTGSETVRLAFDSNSGTSHPSDDYHIDQAGLCQPPWSFDFVKKAYYIEATLSHNPIAFGSAAGIQVIKVSTTPCRG